MSTDASVSAFTEIALCGSTSSSGWPTSSGRHFPGHLARAVSARPGAWPDGRAFTVTPQMSSLLGASGEDLAVILKGLGYRMEQRPKPPEPAATGPVPASPEAAVSELETAVSDPAEAPSPRKPPNEEPPVVEPATEPPTEPPDEEPPVIEPEIEPPIEPPLRSRPSPSPKSSPRRKPQDTRRL